MLDFSCRTYVKSTFLLLSALFFNIASALPVTIQGSLFNSNFDITYDDSLVVGLYGAPMLSDNTIFFAPNTFSAQAPNGSSDSVSGLIELLLSPHNNYAFDSFGLEQAGDYILLGSSASVNVSGNISVNNTGFAEQSNAAIVANSSLTNSGINNWSASASIDANTGPWKPVSNSSVIFTVENILEANTSSVGELAFIESKIIGSPISARVGVVSVPESQALWLFAAAMTAFLISRRLKKS